MPNAPQHSPLHRDSAYRLGLEHLALGEHTPADRGGLWRKAELLAMVEGRALITVRDLRHAAALQHQASDVSRAIAA